MELSQITDKHPSMAKRIKAMEKTEKTAEILLKLADFEGTKIIVKHLEQMIEAVNEKLLYERGLAVTDRECLLKERDCWSWLISQFDAQNQVLKRINDFKKKYE